jgi:hypothetical protein
MTRYQNQTGLFYYYMIKITKNIYNILRGVSESSWTVIVVTALVK